MRHAMLVTFEELAGSDIVGGILPPVGAIVSKGKKSYRVTQIRRLMHAYELVLTPFKIFWREK